MWFTFATNKFEIVVSNDFLLSFETIGEYLVAIEADFDVVDYLHDA